MESKSIKICLSPNHAEPARPQLKAFINNLCKLSYCCQLPARIFGWFNKENSRLKKNFKGILGWDYSISVVFVYLFFVRHPYSSGLIRGPIHGL